MPRRAHACRRAVTSEGFIGIEKKAFQAQLGGFEQVAQLGKDAFQFKSVVLVAGLGRGHGQCQALVVGQEQGIGRAARFTPLVANRGPAVLGQRVAAVELDAGQVEDASVQVQSADPKFFTGNLLALGVKMVVHALPAQRLACE